MSAMASKATVVWLRDELRVHDNALLAEAARRGAPVLPVFCLDPRVFDASAKSDLGASQKTGARRAKFVLESLEDLRGSLRDLGSGLVVRRGSPRQVLADICEELGDITIISSEAACSEEQKDEAAVSEIAPLTKVWDGTLYHRDDLAYIPFKDQFTAWRTSVEKGDTPVRADCFPRPRDLPAPPSFAGLDDAIPSLDDLGYGDASVDTRGDFFDPRGGEAAALERLQKYVWDEDRLRTYFDTRNGAGPASFRRGSNVAAMACRWGRTRDRHDAIAAMCGRGRTTPIVTTPPGRHESKLTHITRHEHVPQSTIVLRVGRPRDARVVVRLHFHHFLLHNFLLDHFSRGRNGRPAAPSAQVHGPTSINRFPGLRSLPRGLGSDQTLLFHLLVALVLEHVLRGSRFHSRPLQKRR